MKRFLDASGAAIALILLAPILLIVAILVRINMGTPVFFRQIRPGHFAEPFQMIKFRTMRDACDARGQPLSDEARLTTLGKTMRSWSLDELPGLWNVLTGDMSLVGPRPLLMDYLPLYSASQSRRHEVRPGVTGWAQVNGRNALSWEEKFALDIWYVDHQSQWLDIKILWMTLRKVLGRDGISAEGEATMPKFSGSRD